MSTKEHITPLSTIPAGGREELRGNLLKPYLLRLRSLKDDGAVRALMAAAGVPLSVVDDETGWISVTVGRRALSALEEALGPGSLTRCDSWLTHPENLGTYVRMLRAATTPLEGYRFLARNPEQWSRVGSYDIEELSPLSARMIYRPRGDEEEAQRHRLFCDAHEGELSGLPRFWGQPDATVVHESCLVKGDSTCTYLVRWKAFTPAWSPYLSGVTGAIVAGGSVAMSGGWVTMSIAAGIGAGLGGIIGGLSNRLNRDRAARTLDKHRIAALERGLSLRGESPTAQGDLSGTVLGGKYRITNKIGSGGIGVVYAAEHVALGSQVAVKVLRGAAAKDASEIARLRREAQVQVSIEHPNVVRTFDLDQMPDGSIYVVMELLRGISLADKLARSGIIAPGFALPIFIQVCRALRAAHEKGIVHRDLKPGNVFLCDDGTAKVLDFGMSKFASAESLTQEGYTLGTPEYMAPEQCIGATVEARTDLYAFGVLMYEALTGELPIVARTRRELLELHQRQIPVTLRQRRPDLDIPEALDQAIMKTLHKNIDDRPASALELERLLAAIPIDALIRSYPPGTAKTKSYPSTDANHDIGRAGKPRNHASQRFTRRVS
jgi:eukaryotic-like serine/threonine-protein kinase